METAGPKLQRGRTWVALGCAFAATAVGAGALGAHALEARLDADQLADWNTAVRYQLFHALALLVYGVWLDAAPARRQRGEPVLFAVGTLFFSGSIYLLVFERGSSWVWPFTPLGGTLLIVAWMLWGWRVLRPA